MDTSTIGTIQCTQIIDTVKIVVNNFTTLGMLTNPDDTICAGIMPTVITGAASVGDGTISYGWEQTVDDGATWTTIVGEITTDYTPPALTADTWYRRIDTTTLGSIQCFEVVDTVKVIVNNLTTLGTCLLYTSPSPRDRQKSRMPSSA